MLHTSIKFLTSAIVTWHKTLYFHPSTQSFFNRHCFKFQINSTWNKFPKNYSKLEEPKKTCRKLTKLLLSYYKYFSVISIILFLVVLNFQPDVENIFLFRYFLFGVYFFILIFFIPSKSFLWFAPCFSYCTDCLHALNIFASVAKTNYLSFILKATWSHDWIKMLLNVLPRRRLKCWRAWNHFGWVARKQVIS